MTPWFWPDETGRWHGHGSKDIPSSSDIQSWGFTHDFTFRPKINQRSEKLAANVYERTQALGTSPSRLLLRCCQPCE